MFKEEDIWAIVRFSLYSSLANVIVIPLLCVILLLLMPNCMLDDNERRYLDANLANFWHKFGSTTIYQDREVPGMGWHLAWIKGLVIIHKYEVIGNHYTRKFYRIYYLGKGLDYIRTLSTDENTVRVRYFEMLSPHRSNEMEFNEKIHRMLTNQQDELAHKICEQYYARKKTSCFISGPPGTGKSYIGRYVMKELKLNRKLRPSLVYGANFTVKGFCLDDVIDQGSRPMILMLDEFDKAFDETVKERKETEYSSIAASETSLNNALDLLNAIENIIIIATSNKSILELEQKYAKFLRKGRFDIKYTMTEKVPEEVPEELPEPQKNIILKMGNIGMIHREIQEILII